MSCPLCVAIQDITRAESKIVELQEHVEELEFDLTEATDKVASLEVKYDNLFNSLQKSPIISNDLIGK